MRKSIINVMLFVITFALFLIPASYGGGIARMPVAATLYWCHVLTDEEATEIVMFNW